MFARMFVTVGYGVSLFLLGLTAAGNYLQITDRPLFHSPASLYTSILMSGLFAIGSFTIRKRSEIDRWTRQVEKLHDGVKNSTAGVQDNLISIQRDVQKACELTELKEDLKGIEDKLRQAIDLNQWRAEIERLAEISKKALEAFPQQRSCKDGGPHDYKARYETVLPANPLVDLESIFKTYTSASDDRKLIESMKVQQYVGEVCTTCGDQKKR